MHVETYPITLAPRDEEPSLSSSEEKSSENDWLERKLTRKQEYIWKIEQVLCSLILYMIYLFLWITWCYITWFSISCSPENKLPRAIYKENYKTKYLRLFTLFSNLITKESYNWWLTRREWKFIQKYLKQNIPMCWSQISGSTKDHFARENDVCEISQTYKKGCEITSQQKVILAGLRSWLSSWGSQLPTCRIYLVTSGGNPPHCTKRLRNHFATKGWFRNTFAKCFLQLRVSDVQCL